MSSQVSSSVQIEFSGYFSGNENAATSVSVPAVPTAHEAVTAEPSRSSGPRRFALTCARTPIEPGSIAQLEAAIRNGRTA